MPIKVHRIRDQHVLKKLCSHIFHWKPLSIDEPPSSLCSPVQCKRFPPIPRRKFDFGIFRPNITSTFANLEFSLLSLCSGVRSVCGGWSVSAGRCVRVPSRRNIVCPKRWVQSTPNCLWLTVCHCPLSHSPQCTNARLFVLCPFHQIWGLRSLFLDALANDAGLLDKPTLWIYRSALLVTE